MEHFQEHNPDENIMDPSLSHPEWVNEVVVDPPSCPLTESQVENLWEEIVTTVDVELNDMNVHRFVWTIALESFNKLVEGV